VYSEARAACQVTINSFVSSFKLSDLVIFAFSEDQELFYDFLVKPSIYSVPLTDFSVTRSSQDALLQSVQNYRTASLNDAANFNIKISKTKIASLLTDALHHRLQSILAALSSIEIGDPYVYFRSNLANLTMQLDFLYRSSSTGTYEAGFSVQVKFQYLTEVLSPEPLVASTTVSPPIYNREQEARSISLNGKFTRDGQVSFAFLKNGTLTNGTEKTAIVANTLFTVRERLGMADYITDAVSGLYVTQPNLTYTYFFKPDNTTVTYTGMFFANFKHNPTTTKANLTLSNYRCYYSSVDNLYNFTVGFTVTPVATFFNQFNAMLYQYTDEDRRPAELQYQIKLSEYSMKDTLRAIELDTASGQLLLYGTVSKAKTSTTQYSAFKSNLHSNTYSLTHITQDGKFFQKITNRVGKFIANQADYSSLNLASFNTLFKTVGERSARVGTTDLRFTDVSLNWSNLTSGELAALYPFTTGKQLLFTFQDSFFNELAVSAFSDIPTVLTRAESPFTNPQQWPFYGQITGTTTLLNKSSIPSAALTTSNVALNVVNQLRVVSASSFIFDSVLLPSNTSFSFNGKLICLAEYTRVVNKVKTYFYSTINLPLIEGVHYSVEKFLGDGGQISKIVVSTEQRKAIATALQFTANQEYRLSILLPFDFVRLYTIATVSKHLVRAVVSNSKYTYGYLWRLI
jgi:hypothetical protein